MCQTGYTISRTKTCNKWYAVVACEVLRRAFSIIIKNRKPAVGIDVGITKFCWHDSDNNNHVVENPQFLTKMLKPLRRAHIIEGYQEGR